MKDYYAILKIPVNSSESDIRKAYRHLAKLYHPDVNKSEDAHDKFIEISEAYEFLINHNIQGRTKYSDQRSQSQNYSDYRSSAEYERMRQEAREKAQQNAKMRYDEFKKKHEAFQKSGINDFILIITVLSRVALIPILLFFIALPVYLAFHNEWTMIFTFLLTWPFAAIIVWYIYDNRKQYFIPGTLYFTPKRIKLIYTEINPTERKCYYCPNKFAESKPYKIELLKLKDVKVKSDGFRQHNANYINDNKEIFIPRSQKAFIIHTICIFIKILSIICSLVFLDVSSIIWRIILGVNMGGVISSIVLWITATKSNVTYLMNYGTLLRVAIWIFIICQISYFSFTPFNIITSSFTYFTITVIILFDCFLMQIIDFVLGKYASKTIFKQYAEVEQKFKDGYKVYNDVTVVSVIYPLFRWIFG